MNIRRAHRAKVTNRSIPGLAALALALVPHHGPAAPSAPQAHAPQAHDTPSAVQVAQVRALIAAERHTQDAAIPLYHVKAGDSISGIAVRDCDGKAADWTDIYRESRAEHLTGPDANLIVPGQELAIVCGYDPAELRYAPVEQTGTATRANVTAVVHPRRSSAVEQAPASYGNVNPANYSGFQRCVIERESGGQSQVMNASGHYGLYQFSESTWIAYGGSAAEFGHASAAEQTRVFDNAMVQGGESNWSPYDGC